MFPTTKSHLAVAAVLLVFTFLISACGGYQEREYGLEDQTFLVLRGENLVGLTIAVDKGYVHEIQKDDLVPYKLGLLGAADSEEESLETVMVEVNPGMRTILVKRSGRVVTERKMQFVTGQKRELRIK